MKKINIAIFDNVNLRKYHVVIDSLRYPRDSLLIDYEENDFIEQYENLNFFKEYIGEPILNLFISNRDMKTKYLIDIIDSRHQPGHTTAKKFQAIKEYGTNPVNARLFLILIRRREIELIRDGNKLIEVRGK